MIAVKAVSRESVAPQFAFPWHWAPIGVFVLYAALHMLDRQLLAALAPAIKREFHLSNTQYGGLLSVYFAVSTTAFPLAGLLIDRVGLTIGASMSILFWSIAGGATAFTRSLQGLIACRFGLALGESGGSSSPGAVLASYMNAAELGIGGAALGTGTSLGAIAAPLLAAALAPRYGWRLVFEVSGALGLLWVPLWLVAAKLVPARFQAAPGHRTPLRDVLSDRRFWGVAAAYAFAKQTLWVSWTTIYFVQERHLTMVEANRRFSWFPSAFGILGAVTVGALAMRWVRRGMSGLAARRKACWLMAPLVLFTALVPFAPTAELAALAVGVGFFANVCLWSATHLMPIDLYGVGRAAFLYSVLECAVSLLQTVISPGIGAMVDHFGFRPACSMMALLPILGLVILEVCLREKPATVLQPVLGSA